MICCKIFSPGTYPASTSTLPPQHDEIEVIGRLDPTEWRQCKSQVILRRASRDSILIKICSWTSVNMGDKSCDKIVGISKGEKRAKVTEISGRWIWMLCRLVWDDLIAVLFFCVTNSSGVRNYEWLHLSIIKCFSFSCCFCAHWVILDLDSTPAQISIWTARSRLLEDRNPQLCDETGWRNTWNWHAMSLIRTQENHELFDLTGCFKPETACSSAEKCDMNHWKKSHWWLMYHMASLGQKFIVCLCGCLLWLLQAAWLMLGGD